MPNVLDQLVDKLGGYDKLNTEELKTYQEHLKIIEGRSISTEDIKTFVKQMIMVIERELVDTKENSAESKNLKARLKNFLLLEQFLFAPERAKEALTRYYKSV